LPYITGLLYANSFFPNKANAGVAIRSPAAAKAALLPSLAWLTIELKIIS
jgi:hypothetical protein